MVKDNLAHINWMQDLKKDVIASRIRKIASYSKNISVYCEDSLSLLKRCVEFPPKYSLIYLDPPYYLKEKGLYRNYYEHDDHLAISIELQSHKFNYPWIVSYDNTAEICDMYRLSKSLSYNLNYTAQQRYIGNEVTFFSHNLNLPNDNTFTIKTAI